MRFTIASRKLGRDVTFSRPGSGYIYIDFSGNKPGTLGQQICDHGRLHGSTMSYSGDSQDEFDNICKSWWRSYLRKEE